MDEIPPFALMRTAILSAQTFGEVKRYVMGEVVPSLIGKSVWNTSMDLWKGVIFVAKNFVVAGHKQLESTLRALLGIPGVHLKALLKSAVNVKPLLASLLNTLSTDEREEVALLTLLLQLT